MLRRPARSSQPLLAHYLIAQTCVLRVADAVMPGILQELNLKQGKGVEDSKWQCSQNAVQSECSAVRM
jgi:hypothetical protein